MLIITQPKCSKNIINTRHIQTLSPKRFFQQKSEFIFLDKRITNKFFGIYCTNDIYIRIFALP